MIVFIGGYILLTAAYVFFKVAPILLLILAAASALGMGGGYGKNGKKGFDTIITRLQKQCYVITTDFRYSTDKLGNNYGWGIAEYSTPEKFFGKKFTNVVYKRTPEESYNRVVRQLMKILPEADPAQIKRILR